MDLKRHLSSAQQPLHCKIGAERQLNVKSRYRKISALSRCSSALRRKSRALLGFGPASAELGVVHWPTLNYRRVEIGDTGDGGSDV